jgi:hypothetical protein
VKYIGPYSARTTPDSVSFFSIINALLMTVVLTVIVFAAQGAHADELHLLVNGKAKHINARHNANYNERNWGGGFQYDYGRKTSPWVPFVTVSGFIDSLESPSYYAGGGMLRRYLISRKLDYLHFDIGFVGFAMTRKDINEGKPFLGALPVISFGSDKIAINITYVPPVDKRLAQLVFMQVKLSSTNFRF